MTDLAVFSSFVPRIFRIWQFWIFSGWNCAAARTMGLWKSRRKSTHYDKEKLSMGNVFTTKLSFLLFLEWREKNPWNTEWFFYWGFYLIFALFYKLFGWLSKRRIFVSSYAKTFQNVHALHESWLTFAKLQKIIMSFWKSRVQIITVWLDGT